MKKVILIISVAVCMVLLISCKSGSTNAKNNSEMENVSAKVYTCTMHPEVRSDKPGNCPKCGMELVVND
jgi:Cu(I)/Ag(I) efflux system membrane fusion protein